MVNMTTGIAWATGTSNPFKGCSKIGPECANCYMTNWAHRHQAMGTKGYDGTTHKVNGVLHPTGKIGVVDKEIYKLKTVKSDRLFVNSMSDTFHSGVDDSTIIRVFDAIKSNNKGTNFLICSKRSDRMADMSQTLDVPANVWMGTTCGTPKSYHRLDDLRRVKAAVRFVSVEPLLEPVDLTPWLADGTLQWVIVGGESGAKHRPMQREWAEAILRQCQKYGVPFFMKQWSAAHPKKDVEYPPTIDGVEWHQLPGLQGPIAPVPPTSPPGGGKDPKRVAAAHKAWVTMRARKAQSNPIVSAPTVGPILIIHSPEPEPAVEVITTTTGPYGEAVNGCYIIKDMACKMVHVPASVIESNWFGHDYPVTNHVNWFNAARCHAVIEKLIFMMREENNVAKRRYYFDQINLVKDYVKRSPKIQKKKWVQLEWGEHVNPHEVKAVLESSVKGLYSVTTADSDDSRYLKLEPCFWLENKDDIIMMLLKGGFKMGGKLIAVSIKRRVKATDEE